MAPPSNIMEGSASIIVQPVPIVNATISRQDYDVLLHPNESAALTRKWAERLWGIAAAAAAATATFFATSQTWPGVCGAIVMVAAGGGVYLLEHVTKLALKDHPDDPLTKLRSRIVEQFERGTPVLLTEGDLGQSLSEDEVKEFVANAQMATSEPPPASEAAAMPKAHPMPDERDRAITLLRAASKATSEAVDMPRAHLMPPDERDRAITLLGAASKNQLSKKLCAELVALVGAYPNADQATRWKRWLKRQRQRQRQRQKDAQ